MAARTIKSAERTLALFEVFSQREEGLTVGQVARELGIPQPSASMLLRNLTDLGYLEYDRRQRLFAPTIRVMLLGSWINRRFSEAGSIPERLRELQAHCRGETVYVGVQNGAAMQYIVSLEADRPDRLKVTSGMFRSLTCSAPGRALLSLKTNSEVAGWVRRCNAEAAEERLKVREGDYLQLIERVRAQGYGESDGDVTPGSGAFAVTIRSPLGEMPLAIGCGGPMTRVRRQRERIVEGLMAIKQAYGRPAEDPFTAKI